MTTTTPPAEPAREVTLLELLEDTAAHVDCFASADGPHDNCNARKRATRLRAAAQRLREEDARLAKKMYNAQHGGDERSETVAWFARDTLQRINGGPLTSEER